MILQYKWYFTAIFVSFYMIFMVDFKDYSVPHKPLLSSNMVMPAIVKPKTVVFQKDLNPILYNAKDIKCLAKNIFFEAGTESRFSKIAVGQVTINRVKTGYWGDNICDVVHAKDQFSWTNKQHLVLDTDSENYKESLTVAKTLLSQKIQMKSLKRALFYHADYVRPNWAANDEKIGKIGKHIYYNGAKGSWLSL